MKRYLGSYLAVMFVVCLGSAGLVLAQTKPSPAEDAHGITNLDHIPSLAFP